MAKGSEHDVIDVGGIEVDQLEETGQESLDGRIARQQADEADVSGARRSPDEVDRCLELRCRDLLEDRRAHRRVGNLRVEDDHGCLAEYEGGRIQVRQAGQPLGASRPLGPCRHGRGDGQEDIDDVVVGIAMEPTGEGRQGGQPPFRRAPGDALRLDRERLPGQGPDAPRRRSSKVDVIAAESLNLLQPVERGDQAVDGRRRGGSAKAVQTRGTGARVDLEESFQNQTLVGRDRSAALAPRPPVGPFAHAGDELGEPSDARQEDLVVDQPGCGQVQQHRGAIIAGPGALVEPPQEAARQRWVTETDGAVEAGDLRDVYQASPRADVGRPFRRTDAQGRGHVLDHRRRGLLQSGHEGAQEADGAELDGEAEPRPIPPTSPDAGEVAGAKGEVPLQLLGGGVGLESSVAPSLGLGQELRRH